ncbi:MAG: prolyl-tRNA synthetase [Gammaproteobacteria bacterium]|jgi:prolyl-tRNA editing enzyme YbaK/EbsC (Cys-tRNA(Pro) deacylase)|nr:prolyl-tRNA synthetase [Gammaproteobacteria bacterium]
MNDIQLFNLDNFLKNENVDYSIYPDIFNLESAQIGAKQYGLSLNEATPTIILKAKDNYFAAIICGSTRIAFKKLKKALNIKDIRIADPETVFDITGSKIGEVSLINPGIHTLIDNHVIKNKNCYGGSGVSKTTLRINTIDLIRITNAKVLDFTESKNFVRLDNVYCD